jgi:hypothetical protein
MERVLTVLEKHGVEVGDDYVKMAKRTWAISPKQ